MLSHEIRIECKHVDFRHPGVGIAVRHQGDPKFAMKACCNRSAYFGRIVCIPELLFHLLDPVGFGATLTSSPAGVFSVVRISLSRAERASIISSVAGLPD